MARVWMKDESVKAESATRWLTPDIYGGDRQTKRAERQLRECGILPKGKYAVPRVGTKLDKYGSACGVLRSGSMMQPVCAPLRIVRDDRKRPFSIVRARTSMTEPAPLGTRLAFRVSSTKCRSSTLR